MNISIVTSSIIGALLLLSLLAWNYRVNQNTGMVTLSQITKQRVEAIGDILNSDIRNIRLSNPSIPLITEADSNRITFTTAINDTTIQSITWQFDQSTPVTSTLNPNDFSLSRTVSGVQTVINFGVTRFHLTFFDAAGSQTSTLANIRRIRAEILTESDAPYGNEYARSYWQTDITPRALQN